MAAQRSPYHFTEEDTEYLQQRATDHAISFLQDCRQYKEHKGLSNIPEVYFSRRFLDELTALLEQDNTVQPSLPSPKRRFTGIFNFKRKRGELSTPCTSRVRVGQVHQSDILEESTAALPIVKFHDGLHNN